MKGFRRFMCLLLILLVGSLALSGCNSEPATTSDPQEVAETETQGYDLDGFPPTIPHELDGRTDCLVCHQEGELGKAPKTSHPELVTCRQCHGLEDI